jgi:hypothetical protein
LWYKGGELKAGKPPERDLIRGRTKQTLKLRLLALVLALALVWYSLNPAPRPVVRKKRKEEPLDEKKQEVKPRSMPATLPVAYSSTVEPSQPADDGEDDFEWPEFIDG